MRTTVIFDLDGVLVDSRAVFISCVNHAFTKLGLRTRSDAELEPYIGPPFPYAFGELLGVVHDAPIVTACIDGYRERYKTASLTETTVAPGIPEALDALAGRRLAVATSKPKAFADPLLDAMGIGSHKELIDAGAERIVGHPGDLAATAAVLLGD
jgi:phosphoglycolate phosphatase